MTRREQIRDAYKLTGGVSSFYDGMMTYSTLPGKAICRIVWNMDGEKNFRYLERALSGVRSDFSGKLLEVPVGTGVSMPLYAEGKSRGKSFWLGLLSGAVEPAFGALTVLLVGLIVPAMPYLLSFAAGAMLYVVVEELIPEMSAGEHSNIGVIAFAFGFSLMMALDVALG